MSYFGEPAEHFDYLADLIGGPDVKYDPPTVAAARLYLATELKRLEPLYIELCRYYDANEDHPGSVGYIHDRVASNKSSSYSSTE